MKEELIAALVAAVMKAISSSGFKKEWIESFIRPVVEKFNIS